MWSLGIKEVDMLTAAAQTPQRAEYLLFSEPHVILPGVIIARKEVRDNMTLQDLKGMKVALVSGYVWQEFISRDHPSIKLDPVHDVQTGLRKASFGIDDAMIENLATATTCIEKETPCTYCPFIKDTLEMVLEQSMEIPAWSYMTIAKRY